MSETIIHHRDKWTATWYEGEEGMGWRQNGKVTTKYMLGELPPHYPVPAINDAWLADPIWEQWITDAN